MIVVKMWGGLCNQMFQYAFGYVMGKEKGVEVHFDTDFYKEQPKYVDYRQFDLNKFFALPYFEVDTRPKSVDFFQNSVVSNIVRRMNFFHCILPEKIGYIRERAHSYSEKIPYYENMDNFYDGYWQSEKYFLSYADEIRKIFTPGTEVIEEVDNWLTPYAGSNTVAVHIRRGDMVSNKKGRSDSDLLSYYSRAMKMMSEKLGYSIFVVFSDDIEWCKKNLSQEYGKIVFQDQNNGLLFDLIGISRCKHGIMSRSTFSWWGNWLGEQDDAKRIVIAPHGVYFNNEFIPQRWDRV